MLTDRELATVLAALRFWQRHGPSQINSSNRLEAEEQDLLNEIQTGSGDVAPLTSIEIDWLCERLNAGEHSDEEPCGCELPGVFYSGVPGILARIEDGRLVAEAKVERCDLCQRYPDDETAFQKLVELGIA